MTHSWKCCVSLMIYVRHHLKQRQLSLAPTIDFHTNGIHLSDNIEVAFKSTKRGQHKVCSVSKLVSWCSFKLQKKIQYILEWLHPPKQHKSPSRLIQEFCQNVRNSYRNLCSWQSLDQFDTRIAWVSGQALKSINLILDKGFHLKLRNHIGKGNKGFHLPYSSGSGKDIKR